MSDRRHSSLPWGRSNADRTTIFSRGVVVASTAPERPNRANLAGTSIEEAEDNAALIEIAVNERPSLLAQLAAARSALEEISSPTQSTNLLWWQIKAREALSTLAQEPAGQSEAKAERDEIVCVQEIVVDGKYREAIVAITPRKQRTLKLFGFGPAERKKARAELESFRAENRAPVTGDADILVGQIENRFPNWRSFRDLLDCIDCTLHDLRTIHQPLPAGSASPGVTGDVNYKLPCDVRLPPVTTIRKGCDLGTLLRAIKQREGYSDDESRFTAHPTVKVRATARLGRWASLRRSSIRPKKSSTD